MGKFQPLPASSSDSHNERDLEKSWDERDTTGVSGMPENATTQAELSQYVMHLSILWTWRRTCKDQSNGLISNRRKNE